MGAPKRKLIEVALPLETINKWSAREKSIRHGHPSTLHPWWSRKPLATARAVLFAQIVDDPSSHPDEFPTEEAQRAERARLHRIIERMVVWENTRDDALFAEARAEIVKSTGGSPPPILDPFAGGGSIPLEAQRLGLEAHGSDLNPVAVLISKALVEIPPRFVERPPVFPGLADSRLGGWGAASGLAADIRAYGAWMRDEAQKRIGVNYPTATLADGTDATVIAWIWARTVTCPNPACGIEMPLTSKWLVGKKKGREAWIRPIIVATPAHPSGKRVEFEIGHGRAGAPNPQEDGTMDGRRGAVCIGCAAVASIDHIRDEAVAGRTGQTLLSTVALDQRQRVYLAPDARQLAAADVQRPEASIDGTLSTNPRWFSPPIYGLTEFEDLFTNRQLVALTTFSDLVLEARDRVLRDSLAQNRPMGDSLESGGTGAEAYADALATYLGLCVSKMTIFHSNLARWRADADKTAPAFGRQAIAMAWDFAEAAPFAGAGGDWTGVLDGAARTLEGLRPAAAGSITQASAQALNFPAGAVMSTDPPYYDNIGYSDLSDCFYAWLRKSLRDVYPSLLSTMLVPKAEELVANPYRHDGKEGAQQFFEDGFRHVFARTRAMVRSDYPITVYYAFKQSEGGDDGEASTGWDTLLDGMIRGGWAITSTWPMRTEGGTRLTARDANSLASSIVLTLRPRSDHAETMDRRSFITALHRELPDALRKLQQGAIAPVDLPQAAIGPGMAIFSRYAKVLDNDGTTMTVRSALTRINEILDQVLNEQEGDFDAATRFAIAWYRQHGYTTGDFGVADNLARARNTSVDTMEREGILTKVAGKVTLLSPAMMPEGYDVLSDDRVGAWEVLHHLIAFLEGDGLPVAGTFLASAQERPDGAVDVELVKELAFLLFSIAEKNGWTQDALAFNTVATAWPDIVQAARATQTGTGDQAAFDFEEG